MTGIDASVDDGDNSCAGRVIRGLCRCEVDDLHRRLAHVIAYRGSAVIGGLSTSTQIIQNRRGGLVELDICYGLGRNAAAGDLEVFNVAVAVHFSKNLWIGYTGWAADQGNAVAGDFVKRGEAVLGGDGRHLGRVRVEDELILCNTSDRQ